MSLLTDFSQSGLLDESLALVDALAPPVSRERWWESAARLQLHDELFRYFVALPRYAVSAHYVEAPRIALEACLSANASNARPPHHKPPLPPLSRPVALTMVEGARARLRNLVALPAIQAALVDTFGSVIVNASVGPGGKSAERPAILLVQAFNQTLSATGGSSYPIPANAAGYREFTLHRAVADQIKQILSQTLPFSVSRASTDAGTTDGWGISPPVQIAGLMHRLDGLDAWLIDGLQVRGALRQDQTGLPLWIWGLALSFTARAYLTDFLCSFTRVALPLDRLYEETRNGAKANLSLDSGGRGRFLVQTKGVYNAYTAVGLVELLSSDPLAHMDAPQGYLKNRGSLRELGALGPFDDFWRGQGAPAHSLVLAELRRAFDKPVLRFQYDPGPDVKQPVALDPMTLEDLRRRMLQHALPAVKVPEEAKPTSKMSPSKKPKAPPKSDSQPYRVCGHFITHVKLAVAKQLAELLSEQVRADHPGIPRQGADYIRISVGSERWGGNHLPHFEHRDGFTFDISIPNLYLQWATGEISPTGSPPAAGRRKDMPKPVKVIGVPEPPFSDQSFFPLANAGDEVIRDRVFSGAVKSLAAALMKGETNVGDGLNLFAGTPVLLGADGDVDDDVLVPNLIGHVALQLAGVRKWVYASYYEHFFAIQVVSALFRSSEWPKTLREETARLAGLIVQAEFIWRPTDHYDHWHVVFNSSSTRLSSLGPDAFRVDVDEFKSQLAIWSVLGVNIALLREALEPRELANASMFTLAVAERKEILELLKSVLPKEPTTDAEKTAAKERRAAQVTFVHTLADAINRASYQDIPSLTNTHWKDWVRNSGLAVRHRAPDGPLPKHWKRWKSDIEAPDLEPGEGQSGDDVSDPP